MEVDIRRIGARGDGIAMTPEGPLYISGTVAGDRVLVRPGAFRGDGRTGSLLALRVPGPGRADPPCIHFGACGGCALQHLADDVYSDWKVEQLRESLARRGFGNVEFDPLARIAPASRRRVRLKAVRRSGRSTVGFTMRESHAIVDIGVCAVVVPVISALFEPLRDLADCLLPHGGRLEYDMTELDHGVDLLVAASFAPDLTTREALASFAAAWNLVRVAWQNGSTPEPIVCRRPPIVTFADVPVELPPGAFLQATRAAEQVLASFVVAELPEGGRVLELFSGCGTFTLPVAVSGRHVRAAEGDAAMVSALGTAVERAGLGGYVEIVRRDLARRPFLAGELAALDAVLLDPPRAGAREQVQALVTSAVPTVVYVSCNPESFARDARILAGGGFRLERILPVDQFLWSPHLELAAVLRR